MNDIFSLYLQLVGKGGKLVLILLPGLIHGRLLVLNVHGSLTSVIFQLMLKSLLGLDGSFKIRGEIFNLFIELLISPLEIFNDSIHLLPLGHDVGTTVFGLSCLCFGSLFCARSFKDGNLGLLQLAKVLISTSLIEVQT